MLSQTDVEHIFQSTMTTLQLSSMYGVSTNTIRSIKRRRTHTSITDKFALVGKANSNRAILPDQVVREIFLFSGNSIQLKSKFGVSKKVAMNIKFGYTYSSVTSSLGYPGEIRVHKLTWDDVCTIRASSMSAQILSELFDVSVGTINNIRTGRTRKFK